MYKSARNIDRVTVSPVAELNALNVLQPRRMLMTKAALDAIEEAGARNGDAKKPAKRRAKKPAAQSEASEEG